MVFLIYTDLFSYNNLYKFESDGNLSNLIACIKRRAAFNSGLGGLKPGHRRRW